MRQGNSKTTIKDVARLAGVSKGTVDRVLHGRGEVSRKSAEAVRKAIAELNYEPNLYASVLASRKARTLACILPYFTEGEFWEKIYAGFVQGGEAVRPLNIDTRVFFYDQYKPESFLAACDEMLAANPSGVVLAPLFKKYATDLTVKLKKQEIPYVYVDTKLEDNDYLAYYGMPPYKSGMLCAKLISERCSTEQMDRVAIVRIIRDKASLSDPTIDRRAGFLDVISAEFPDCQILQVFIDPNEPKKIYSTLDAFFKQNGPVRNIVMFNSRIHLLSEYLEKNPVEGRRVIGFDDLEKNLLAVREGLVSILVSQHTQRQSLSAVNTLADFILKGRRPEKRDNFMHMDILTGYNLEDY